MKYIHLFALCFIVSLPATAEQQSTTNSSAAVLLDSLESRFSTIKTVQSRFKETKKLKIFDSAITIDGRFCLENPDKLAWRIDSPIKYVLVLDGEYARQWDEDGGQTQKIKTSGDPVFEQVLGQIKKWFSGDFKSLVKDFEMEVLSNAPVKLKFRPVKESIAAKVVKSVTITVRNDLRYVEQISLEDISGDLTEISFYETRLNELVGDDEWKVGPVEK